MARIFLFLITLAPAFGVLYETRSWIMFFSIAFSNVYLWLGIGSVADSHKQLTKSFLDMAEILKHLSQGRPGVRFHAGNSSSTKSEKVH